MNKYRINYGKARIIRIEKIKASESLTGLSRCEPPEICFAGWQAGHGDALKAGNPLSSKLDVELSPKHLGRAGLLLRAPALGGLCPTVTREHRKEPHSARRGVSSWIGED
jgi:hypothetical protein